MNNTVCPNCGKQNQGGKTYCWACGSLLVKNPQKDNLSISEWLKGLDEPENEKTESASDLLKKTDELENEKDGSILDRLLVSPAPKKPNGTQAIPGETLIQYDQRKTAMTYAGRRLRVFLCHSSGDKPVVRKLYRQLGKERWIDPWLDEEKLLPGEKWDMEIRKAVRAADIVIVCLSRGAVNKEGYIQKEIKHALDIADEKPDGTIFVIPLKLEACDVPDRLSTWQWVDYYEEGAHKRLLLSLRKRASALDISDG